jgi:hypothetical protein
MELKQFSLLKFVVFIFAEGSRTENFVKGIKFLGLPTVFVVDFSQSVKSDQMNDTM